MVQKSRWLLIGLCLGMVSYSIAPAADDDIPSPLPRDVLIDSDETQITVQEVMLYLEWLALANDGAVENLSGQRVSQAVIELYALKLLDHDAADTAVYSPSLTAWLPEHLLAMARVSRFVDLSVYKAMLATDWESEAREFYSANLDEFIVPETVTIRTLLLSTDTRSSEEALEMAQSLLTDQLPEQSFESLVVEYSDDEVGRADGGLMENVARGQTVPTFEDAAFSLSEPGQLSGPVVSPFGVHLIQLLSKAPARISAFEEVSAEIVGRLKRIRKAEYREAIQNEARSREPAGYRINESAIDAFMASLGHRKLGVPKAAEYSE